MKLKCNDGKVRRFRIASLDICFAEWVDSLCLECGKRFGVHDTKILKPKFKEHTCNFGGYKK